MKRKLFLWFALAAALPLAASADDVSFTSSGGTFSGTSEGYVLTNATLTQVSGLGGGTGSGDLGSLSFSTGILGSISNVITGGPILAGGTLTITGNGSDGLPAGTLFTGTFAPGGTWGFVLQSDGTHLYTLNTDVTGQDSAGNVTGTMTFVINIGPGIFPGTTSASGTDTVNLVAVPEPAELSLLGMGGLGLAGAIRQKLKISCLRGRGSVGREI